MTQSPECTVGFAEPTDHEAMNDLFNLAFGKTRTMEEFRWKFLESPWKSNTPVGVVCRIDQQVVGIYCMSPHRLLAQGSTIDAIQVVDSCVHPHFQRRGINQKALEFFLKEAPAFSRFAYGFPGEVYAAVGLQKLGHRLVTTMRGYIRMTRMLSADMPRPASGTDTVDCSTEIPADWQSFLLNAGARSKVGTQRTSEFMNWRYRQTTNSCFRFFTSRKAGAINGLLVARSADHNSSAVWIYDLIASSPDVLVELNQALDAIYAADRPREVIFICSEYSPWQDELQQLGFKQADRGPSHVVAVHLGGHHEELEFLFDPTEWSATLADTDL